MLIPAIEIPTDRSTAELTIDGDPLKLTHLDKIFWPEDGLSKGALLQYYADISPLLLPHLANRAIVMKGYPDGAYGKFFFQKRVPDPRPKWIPICEIQHPSANLVDFPVIQNLAGLLWVINLGCIDLNPWYARCDDVDRPDYLHFDLDPTAGSDFKQVLEAAPAVRDALAQLKIPSIPKCLTLGARPNNRPVGPAKGTAGATLWSLRSQPRGQPTVNEHSGPRASPSVSGLQRVWLESVLVENRASYCN